MWILVIFLLWFSILNCADTPRPKYIDNFDQNPKYIDSSCKQYGMGWEHQYGMGISGHFIIENYAWRLGIIQNICEYFWYFLS